VVQLASSLEQELVVVAVVLVASKLDLNIEVGYIKCYESMKRAIEAFCFKLNN